MSLNIEAIDKTIVRIRDNVNEEFNMLFPSCCIIGFARRANDLPSDVSSSEVEKLFGFKPASDLPVGEMSDGNKLFFFTGYSYPDTKREHAVKVLEHLRDTGKVDWTVAGIIETVE